MEKIQAPRFSELIEERLRSDEQARQLWIPIAAEFERSGPDGAKEYLDAECQLLEERVRRLFNQIERR